MAGNIVVLISGRGSNLEALLQQELDGNIVAVISNRPDAGGLEHARKHGIDAIGLDHKQYSDRTRFDAALIKQIDSYTPKLVVLAGYMRLLSDGFVSHYAGRLINIHPSLLPSFTGLHTHQRALDEGVRMHGCTVHFVTAELDHGPIIIQAAVPVMPTDTANTLAARVLTQEHQIFPQAVRWFMQDRLTVDGNRVFLQNDCAAASTSLIHPPLDCETAP